MFGNVFFEGRRGLVLAPFDFYRNDLRAVLDQEVDLPVPLGAVSRLHLELAVKLLQDKILGQGPLELIIGLQKDGAVVNARHVFEEAGVKEEELEMIQPVKSGKRMLHPGDIVDAMDHTGGDKPFDRLLKISGPAALTDSPVHELLVGFGKLRNDAAEDHENTPAVDLAVVFGEVVLVDLDELPLNPGYFRRVFVAASALLYF